MTARRRVMLTAALGLGLALAGPRGAHGQSGALGTYGGNSFGNFGVTPSFGYGIRTGQLGPGYQSAGGIYRPSYYANRPQTTIQLQPLFSAITSLPGWDGPTTRRVHRRVHTRAAGPRIPPYDRYGKILWPGTIPSDPESADLRRAAESAFQAVVRESKSTGHASIRPVIDTKGKLSAYERRILPDIKARNVTDGDDLERFFVDLDRSLDAMNSVF